MAKSNGSSKELPETPPAITSLSIAGFKSIVEEQTLEIRPLTLLAGANSSGKSSMMQPLLLLKQTLEAPYDPGPLLLNGPNVKFTSARQFHPVGPGTDSSATFVVKVGTANDTEFGVGFCWADPIKKLELKFNKYKLNKSDLVIDHNVSFKEFNEFVRPLLPAGLLKRLRNHVGNTHLRVIRDKFFFDVKPEGEEPESF